MSKKAVPSTASQLAVQDGDAARRFPATLLPGTRRVMTRCFDSSKSATYAVITPDGQRRPVEQNLGCLEPLHLQVFVLAGPSTPALSAAKQQNSQPGDGVTALGSDLAAQGKLGQPAETPAGQIFALDGDMAKLEPGHSVGGGSRRPLGAVVERGGLRYFAPFDALATLEPRAVAAAVEAPITNQPVTTKPASVARSPKAGTAGAKQKSTAPRTISIRIDALIPLPSGWK